MRKFSSFMLTSLVFLVVKMEEELYDAMIGLTTGKHTKSSLADVFRHLSRYVND
jgi:hypothetical protein